MGVVRFVVIDEKNLKIKKGNQKWYFEKGQKNVIAERKKVIKKTNCGRQNTAKKSRRLSNRNTTQKRGKLEGPGRC